jgi:hypothetical protein
MQAGTLVTILYKSYKRGHRRGRRVRARRAQPGSPIGRLREPGFPAPWFPYI